MQLSLLLSVTALAPTILAATLGDSAEGFIRTTSISWRRRGLNNYGLDGFLPVNGLAATTTTQATIQDHDGDTATPTQTTDAAARTLFSPLTSTQPSTATGDAKKKLKESSSTATGTVIVNLPTFDSHNASPQTPTPTAHPATAPSAIASGAAEPAQAAESTSAKEWKIIGVAVIAFSTVAAILLLSVFFDQWWRFVRDVIGRKRRGHNFDDPELVPDWEKAEWELRCGRDRQRYPSFTSLPSSLPSVPLVQEPQAVLGKRENVETSGRGPVRKLDGTLGVGTIPGQRVSSSGAGVAGIGVGLGIGRVVDGKAVSPRGPAMTSPRQQHTRSGQAYASQGANPFDDANSPMPDDVYGGMVH